MLYKFVALSNGLKSGPLIFTKVMRMAIPEMQKQGHESATYVDDVYLQGDTLTFGGYTDLQGDTLIFREIH